MEDWQTWTLYSSVFAATENTLPPQCFQAWNIFRKLAFKLTALPLTPKDVEEAVELAFMYCYLAESIFGRRICTVLPSLTE